MRTKKLTFEQVIAMMDKMQIMINPLIELAKQKQQSELPKMENGSVLDDYKANTYKNNTEWYKRENEKLRKQIEILRENKGTLWKKIDELNLQLQFEIDKNHELTMLNKIA